MKGYLLTKISNGSIKVSCDHISFWPNQSQGHSETNILTFLIFHFSLLNESEKYNRTGFRYGMSTWISKHRS